MTTGQIARIIGTVFDDPEAQIVCLDVEQELAFGLENFGIPSEEMEERITSALAWWGFPISVAALPSLSQEVRSSVWP
ncbi:hypothetical protein N752_09990 [Desulforamulus aquiferis]|nr:hypothetical protein [Desulforamulus aquiferis]RYD05295.1 hypothetical protein N752_09990 [Desulforamulus aquiferis]